jgi:hypothetical protein
MLRKAQKQTIADLEEATKLADVLYETCQHMGFVIDQLLKDRGIERQHSESFEILLNGVLRQREGHREEAAEQGANGNKVQGNAGYGVPEERSITGEVSLQPSSG